ncbi:hypothetical protein B0H11DRAFT_163662 [Mycena galericulata]|nr:hypothetical protein B0H11DRAFT_163662 [Mycena galericulata]
MSLSPGVSSRNFAGPPARGILAASSRISIQSFTPWFLTIAFLFLTPFIAWDIFRKECATALKQVHLTDVDKQNLGGTLIVLYIYWVLNLFLCLGLLERWKLIPNFLALNQVKWFERRFYHRSHASFIRPDRLAKLIEADIFTVFILGAGRTSLPMLVSKTTTAEEVLETLRQNGYLPSNYRSTHMLATLGKWFPFPSCHCRAISRLA